MYDFIAIGDTATDVFIKLEDDSGAKIEGIADTPDYRISLPFAAKIPYKEAITISGVGNAPNAAVSAARLGLRSALLAYVGDDQPGDETITSLGQLGVGTSLITKEAHKPTNYSYILWYKEERTILRRKEEFNYVLPDLGTPSWIYLSSIGSNSLDIYKDLVEYLDRNPNVKLSFQPGTKEIPLGEKLSHIYKRADIFFSNVEEAETILGINTLGIEELIKRFHELGPKIVVITDGPKGAYAYDGVNLYKQLPYPDIKPPFERTGAGDAFASTTVSALALSLDLPTALQWGAVNSMSVVQEVGAHKGLLSRAQIEEYLKSVPAEFTKKIN